ncbi:MAG: hypothetical protein WC119_01310 [Synergistaceae bacterium]
MKKRVWAYLQNPKDYEITCDLCGGTNIEWSEWEGLIWCYDCEKDTKGTEGIFDGPIMPNICELMGISFDELNIETGDIRNLAGMKPKIDGNYIGKMQTKKG